MCKDGGDDPPKLNNRPANSNGNPWASGPQQTGFHWDLVFKGQTKDCYGPRKEDREAWSVQTATALWDSPQTTSTQVCPSRLGLSGRLGLKIHWIDTDMHVAPFTDKDRLYKLPPTHTAGKHHTSLFSKLIPFFSNTHRLTQDERHKHTVAINKNNTINILKDKESLEFALWEQHINVLDKIIR